MCADYLTTGPSTSKKGKGFWRMRNELLTDFEYIKGCNEVIKDTLTHYSNHLRQLKTHGLPSNEQYCNAPFDINYTLLHDVTLMEARSFTMKYEALRRKRKNEEKNKLENEIDKIQNTSEEEEIKRLETLRITRIRR